MKTSNTTPIILHGLRVSKGVVLGKCKLYTHGQADYQKRSIKKNQIDSEIKKFEDSIKITLTELKNIKRKIKPNARKNIGIFLDTHIMLIHDKTFIGKIKKNIKNKLRCADWAIFEEYLDIKSSFDEMQDAYIKQRIGLKLQ